MEKDGKNVGFYHSIYANQLIKRRALGGTLEGLNQMLTAKDDESLQLEGATIACWAMHAAFDRKSKTPDEDRVLTSYEDWEDLMPGEILQAWKDALPAWNDGMKTEITVTPVKGKGKNE